MRFVLVGGFNTLLGYGLFVVLQLGFGKNVHWGYLLSLYLSWAIASIVAFVLHRRFTFRISGRGHLVRDFLRFEAVNAVSLAANTILLPLLVELGHLVPIFAQALIVVVTTIVSYVGHKFFSFRRSKRAEPDSAE